MRLTVSKFAKLADTTVRTLRHYRQLGILVPSQKNENDHYIYVNEDFKRLHEIQLLQSLGLSLNEIKVCLENPKYSFKEIIRVQEQSLQQRREAIDYSLALIERIQLLTDQDQLSESNSEILMLLMNSMRVVNDLKPDHPCIQQQLQDIVANTPLNNLIFYNGVDIEELYKNVKPYESLVPKHTMDFLKEAFEVFNTKKNSSLKD